MSVLEDRHEADLDIEEAFGLVPEFFQRVPDYLLPTEWASFKSLVLSARGGCFAPCQRQSPKARKGTLERPDAAIRTIAVVPPAVSNRAIALAMSQEQPMFGTYSGHVFGFRAPALNAGNPKTVHFQPRRGEGIEPSKRGAAPPCRF